MNAIVSFIRNLFASESTAEPAIDPQTVLHDSESGLGVISVRDQVLDWRESYTEEYEDFLTTQDALRYYEKTAGALERLEPLLKQEQTYDEDVVDAAKTLQSDLQEYSVLSRIETTTTSSGSNG